jgi:oxygen-independent coproporphyrinogen-3 oxidase
MNTDMITDMNADMIARYAAPVPRYTSYPTAPHFHDGVDKEVYRRWLAEDTDAPLSLYVHIPFCDRLCFYCGCHTRQVRRYHPVAAYVEALAAEIGLVASCLPKRRAVTAIHFGGGSPTIVSPQDLVRLREALDRHFHIRADCEISVEIDPTQVDAGQLAAWRALGMTRASVGVQDFDPAVQAAINRAQSLEQTAEVVRALRDLGIASVNLDIVYGLPHQDASMLLKTIDMSLSMVPDRLALFGYAHVPWLKKHQSLIDSRALAGPVDRFRMARLGAQAIVAAGYVPAGLDHFARPDDTMARAVLKGALRRNFQGYTTDDADCLLGFGASSIGRLRQGYVQNITATGQYCRAVSQGRLPVARGFALSQPDRAAGSAIESLMCRYAFSIADLRARFGKAGDAVGSQAMRVHLNDRDGLTCCDGETFSVTPQGRPFVRTIASKFDGYLERGQARHSTAV